MFISFIDQLVGWIQMLSGLIIAIMGVKLMRRNRDGAVKILTAWGVFWLLGGLWGMYLGPIARVVSVVSPIWMIAISGVFFIGGHVFLLATGLYALWRLWRASTVGAKHD